MAATMTSSNELTYFSFPIEKTETNADGDLVVYGKASDGSVDSDEQIVDPAWMGKAVQDWLATGANVRVQHNAQRDPAGVGVEASSDSDGTTWVKSLVFEPTAMKLVSKGALRAYSVGIARPKIVRDSVARGGRIVDGELVEISLVDRPANKNCGIQLVKSAGADGHAELSGKMFGDEDVTSKSVTVELPKDVSVSFSPADLAKLLEHRRVAEKREMDPSTGGGVDRDKIPAADFAGKDRSFPIVTPKDVSDAASSIGRAGADNYSSDKLKANIIRIAKRKGDAFVAALPDSWKGGVVGDLDKAKGKRGKKPAFLTDDKDDAEAKPDAIKGAKDCVKCGKSYHADAKVRKCEGCGAKLPKASGVKDAQPDATKGDHYSCLGCGKELDDDDKFCSNCGKANPACDDDKGDDVTKGMPTPGDGVTGATTAPVPPHREPDGAAIEAFEADAGIPTVPDASVKAASESDEVNTVMRLKSVGVDSEVGFLHDALCPAHQPDAVKSCYPDRELKALDAGYWGNIAMDAAANAPLDQATEATKLWQHAVTLKSTDPEIVEELRAEAHKAFGDANPGPGSFPSPSALSASQFRRPVLTAGHASPGTSYAGPNTATIPASGGITASQFQRGPLTTGQAADSPSNKSVVYGSTTREGARAAILAMHDSLAKSHPALCPMTDSPVTPAPVAPVIETVKAPEVDAKKSAKKLAKLQKTINQARAELGLGDLDLLPAELLPTKKVTKSAEPTVVNLDLSGTVSGAVDTERIAAMIAKMQGDFTAQLGTIEKSLAEERTRSEKLQADIDALGDLPDPATAPFKGVAQAAYKAAAPGVPQLSAETAERAQRNAWIATLENQWRNSPYPEQREAAEKKLRQLNNLL